ncbi:2-dehydro-3-deoxygalactonokinase [Gallibacterium melopsittaci]|uniref:2-dehydro-3-deoxygalactonokinase n=1 Tax=Gallibacterium melopsittaci TaxID=516063 RepID=A0ABV6HT90_9PAST
MIVVDWGTTNFRAYHVVNDNDIKLLENNNKGMKFIPNGMFEQEIYQLFKQHDFLYDLSGEVVCMAGMVGAKNGWHEVPYLAAPTSLERLVSGLYSFELSWGVPAFIVPGMSITNKFGLFDVMRGEETQLLGLRKLVADDTLSVILPGTHSKHATVNNDQLTDFCTMMTGELFALLNQYSILTQGMPEIYDDEEGFLQGVEIGYDVPLSNALFSVRTQCLNQKLSSKAVRSYLSGVIIGNEIQQLSNTLTHYIIGSKGIATRYQTALSHLGYHYQLVDGETCFLQGIKFIANQYLEGK